MEYKRRRRAFIFKGFWFFSGKGKHEIPAEASLASASMRRQVIRNLPMSRGKKTRCREAASHSLWVLNEYAEYCFLILNTAAFIVLDVQTSVLFCTELEDAGEG